MLSLYKTFDQDTSLETKGLWVNYGDFRVLIARAGGANQKFTDKLQAAMKPYRHQIDNDTLSQKTAEDVLMETYAATVVLGWESKNDAGEWVPTLPDRDGVAMECTPANVKKVFKALPEFFKDIQQLASKAASFKRTQEDADAKN